MVESGIIAEGSVKGFVIGTHFNRCKKLHVVVALSFKMLHFRAFLAEYLDETEDGMLYENEIIEILEHEKQNPGSCNENLSRLHDLMDRYNAYTQNTLAGKHGQTAQFFSLYIWYIELFLTFERAIRTSDLSLYIYTAHRMCSLFFMFNHQNYARWLTRNLDDLINITETHPSLLEDLEGGALSIRRTTKQFCRTAIDLTLEQTINANAANKLTGITAFTNSLSARQRWSVTHSVRTAVSTFVMDFLDLGKSSEGSDQYNNKIFNRQVQKFTEEVCKNFNPFSDDINPSKLFNLASGQAATPEVAEFLINVDTNGFDQMKKFIKECREDGTRFENAIRRNVIKNFASESIKIKKSTRKHIEEAKIERNILGKVLCLALDNEINLKSILSYPLATVPHALAHFEGSIASGKQTEELAAMLTAKVDNRINTPETIDVDIIDGFNLLNDIKDAPLKYGQLAKYVLRTICNTNAVEIHVFFHKHKSPSPRDVEMRKRRDLFENASLNYRIQGPNQERTSSLAKCLQSDSFKEELIKFLITNWSSIDFEESILGEKRVFVSFGEKCYLFSANFERGKILSTFENNHFEIESKIILHLYKIRWKNIKIKTTNADTLLIYMLYHLRFWENSREIWIQTGDQSKNNVQMINVRQIYNTLSSVFVNALVAWFIFTGCIYEPTFYGKGRKTCLKILEKNIQFQSNFANIGSNDSPREEDIAALEKFTCQLYGTQCEDVDESRSILFQKAFALKADFDFFQKGNS